MGWGHWREAQEGGDTCILIADSHCCTTETNAAFENNYPPVKKNKVANQQVPII